MHIPQKLRHLGHFEAGRAWLADLPQLVSELERDWHLELGPPFEGSSVSYVVPATQGDLHLVLKVQWPHDECLLEADALRVWDGDGSVALLGHDAQKHALLLERCQPGISLAATHTVDFLEVLASLLPRLWKRTSLPFRPLSDEAREWADGLVSDWDASEFRCERRFIDAASAFIDELADTQGEQVLVHQDLHGDNVLAAQRQPWLAIDPKPLLAEREFSLAPIIRSFEFGHSCEAVVGRLDRLSIALNLDRQRARGWAVAQTVAWSFDSTSAEQHYETVRWLLDAA